MFCITQSGLSVVTSLTEGESLTNHVGLLDVRRSQFRLVPVQLWSVWSFMMGNVGLREHSELLNADNPRVEINIIDLLEKEVDRLNEDSKGDVMEDNIVDGDGDENESEDNILVGGTGENNTTCFIYKSHNKS